jgi:phage gp29-like protein
VEKLAIFTYQQEGGNYAGRSLLRAMYQHWYIKANLYKIDAIANERGGVGVPWMAMGPDAKAEDRKTAIGWMQSLTAHERAAIVVPHGWTFKVEGVSGQVRDAKDSIHHHNMQISMAGLAMFMMLGQGGGGARALGETMADFFYLSLQSLANQVARTFNLTTIKRLVAFNFPGVRAPRLVPQQVLSFKLETIVEALSKLAASSMVQPDPDMESWLRVKLGLPEAAAPRVKPPARSAAVDIPPPQGGAENAKFGAGSGKMWLEIPMTGHTRGDRRTRGLGGGGNS